MSKYFYVKKNRLWEITSNCWDYKCIGRSFNSTRSVSGGLVLETFRSRSPTSSPDCRTVSNLSLLTLVNKVIRFGSLCRYDKSLFSSGVSGSDEDRFALGRPIIFDYKGMRRHT